METGDFALIQRTLEGDQSAFTTLVDKYQKWVHTLVWRKTGDFHIAEEITQDVFLKVYKKLSTLKPSDHFTGWLYVIATRHCIAWLRKKKLRTMSLDAMPISELEEFCYTQYETERDQETALEYQREIIKRLLQKLPESERTVMTLHYLAEMSCEKISEFLGVSPNTIKSRLHRARKRLENQKHLLHEASSIFQVSPTLTENIMRKVAQTKPAAPAVSKPWVPWGVSFAATFFVILMMGFGTRALSRFQQPYSLDATSEMTVELIETSIVRELKRKSDALTRFGGADTLGEKSGSGFQTESPLIAAAQTDWEDISTTKPQWTQTNGPGGVSKPGLFLTSDESLYAIAKNGLYRFTEKEDAWTFVSTSGPNREFDPVMAERGDTLYFLTSDEILVSTDGGKTLNALSARPEGHPVDLVITDIAMYLVLKTKVFRSDDFGNQWKSIGEVLQSDNAPDIDSPNFRIWDAIVTDNTLFVGTNRGLFRFTDAWKKLPVPTLQGAFSLAVAEDRIYVGTTADQQHGSTAAVFYSTNLGDSWMDITPSTHEHSVKLISAVKVVAIRNTLMVMGPGGILLSYDGGDVWTDPGRTSHGFAPGLFPVVALGESNFYKVDLSGITRSTDGGFTWHPFMVGLVTSDVQGLTVVKNILYAVTAGRVVKSADSGESWSVIGIDVSAKLLMPSVGTTDNLLYVSGIADNRVQLFHLPLARNGLEPVQDMPDFSEDSLYVEWKKRLRKAREAGVNVHETEQLWRDSLHLIAQEDSTNGKGVVTRETVFMEHRRKLFRWQFGEAEWHYTGLEDRGKPSPLYGKGFILAVSGNTVYVGKREGNLFRSLDNGDTWNDITANLAFPFRHFKEIVFAGSAIYVSTDMGVMRSRNGETWHVLTDANGNRLAMDRVAVDSTKTTYGVCDDGIYQADIQTDTWKQIVPEVPYTPTSFAIDSDMFYIGTKQNGVFRFQRDNRTP